jgi:hypothetical protein
VVVSYSAVLVVIQGNDGSPPRGALAQDGRWLVTIILGFDGGGGGAHARVR